MGSFKILNTAQEGPQPQAIDPVCGMKVNPARTAGTVEHDSQTYYFCCTHCAEKFKADPQRYLTPKPMGAAVAAHPRDSSTGHHSHQAPQMASGPGGEAARPGHVSEMRHGA